MFKTGISLLALLAATPAFAEDNDEIIVTALGIEQPRDEVGQAVTVIDAQTIETRQTVSIADLIATTPGVRFNRADAVGGVTGISIRGAETTQTLVLLDGVKINDPSIIGDAYDFGNLLTGNIRRIEVLRGSNSVVYGSQAIGGVVNIMTGEPSEDFGGNASVDFGYADTLNAKANLSGTSGIASGGVGVAYFRTDGISAAQGGTEKDGYENIATNAKLKLSFTDSLSLDLRGYYIHADLDTDIFFGEPMESTDSSKLNQYIGYAGLNLSLFDGTLTNRAAITWFRNDRDYDSSFGPYGYSGTNLRFEYEGVYQPIDQAKLVFGYEHERPDYESYYFDFFTGDKVVDTAKANIDSVYALAVIKPFTGLALTGGVRHDDHSQFGGATTFGANANYTPNGGRTNIRASYGEGFKAPSLYQLYDSFSGNSTLSPEQSKSYDIGIDQRLNGNRAILSLTAFQRDIRDQIDFDFGTSLYFNLGRTRAKGVEAMLTLRPVDALTVTAAYSYIDARDRDTGARLPRRPTNAVSVSADYDWSFGLSTGATLTMVSDSFNNATLTQRIDGYALLGVRASFPITQNLEIYGRIDNLTDEAYATVYGYNTYGRSAFGGVRVRF